MTTGMWQLPTVEHPSRVPSPERRLELRLPGCQSSEWHGCGDSPLHIPSSHCAEKGAEDVAVHRDNNKLMPKEFASVTKQCLSWVTLCMRWQKLWGTGGKGAHCMGLDGRGHRQLLPLPIVPACCTKSPGEEPGQGAGGHGVGGHGNSSARLPETQCITGACLVGCWGYWRVAAGMEAPRSGQSPRVTWLLCPSAQLDPAEEKP